MAKIWELTYDELFFLGNEVKAKYINCDYYNKISNIDNGVELVFKEAKNSLGQKKYLTENFFGESQISEELKKVIKPIFFSENFSNVIVSNETNHLDFVVTRYYNDDGVTFVKAEDNCLKISHEFFDEDFKKYFSDANDSSEEPDKSTVDFKETQLLISLKRFENLIEQMPQVYVYCQGYVYHVLPDKQEFISLNDFYKIINELF